MNEPASAQIDAYVRELHLVLEEQEIAGSGLRRGISSAAPNCARDVRGTASPSDEYV